MATLLSLNIPGVTLNLLPQLIAIRDGDKICQAETDGPWPASGEHPAPSPNTAATGYPWAGVVGTMLTRHPTRGHPRVLPKGTARDSSFSNTNKTKRPQ